MLPNVDVDVDVNVIVIVIVDVYVHDHDHVHDLRSGRARRLLEVRPGTPKPIRPAFGRTRF